MVQQSGARVVASSGTGSTGRRTVSTGSADRIDPTGEISQSAAHYWNNKGRIWWKSRS